MTYSMAYAEIEILKSRMDKLERRLDTALEKIPTRELWDELVRRGGISIPTGNEEYDGPVVVPF